MPVVTQYLNVSTKGNADVIDITAQVDKKLATTKLKDGIVTICVSGSTAALTTCEYEPGLVKDIKDIFDKLIPPGRYNHDDTWGDGNGHSHLRASLVGPSLTMPFCSGKMTLGTWQQIILIDFDNRARQRKLVLQFTGE